MKRTIALLVLFALLTAVLIAFGVTVNVSTFFKLGVVRHEKASLDDLQSSKPITIEFPEKIPIELEINGMYLFGHGPDGEDIFRLNIYSEIQPKVTLALAEIGAWIEKNTLGADRNGQLQFFRVVNAHDQEGYMVIRDGKLTWESDAREELQQFNLIVIKTKELLIFQWEAINK